LGTEIRTFYSLRDFYDYLVDQIQEYKTLYEDYSQWLGSLLRAWEDGHKNEEWFQKSVGLQKNMRGAAKNMAEEKSSKKNGGGKGKKGESSCWVQSGEALLCSTDQGEAEVLFEAIGEISRKIQSLEKFKGSLQQLERLGVGKGLNYITYIKDDIPERIVLRSKDKSEAAENLKFAADFTVQGLPP
jgi:hypothetical protein